LLTGTASGIDPSGRQLVERDGARTAVSAGDVVHVRTAG
jgi:BirA family biotin operon repressor/biotin-[acetyl-CoA-carboxylase] ligase